MIIEVVCGRVLNYNYIPFLDMPVYEWEGIYKFFKYVPMQILCSVNNSYVAYIISGADTFPSFQCLLNCRNWT